MKDQNPNKSFKKTTPLVNNSKKKQRLAKIRAFSVQYGKEQFEKIHEGKNLDEIVNRVYENLSRDGTLHLLDDVETNKDL